MENKNDNKSGTVEQVFNSALENAVNLYYMIKNKGNKDSNYNWKEEAGKILNGEKPKIYERNPLMSQMALWSIIGYGNFGTDYLDVICSDPEVSKKIIVGLMNIIDPEVNNKEDKKSIK